MPNLFALITFFLGMRVLGSGFLSRRIPGSVLPFFAFAAATPAAAASPAASAAATAAPTAAGASALVVALITLALLAPASLTALAQMALMPLFERALDLVGVNHYISVGGPPFIFSFLETVLRRAFLENFINIIESIGIFQMTEGHLDSVKEVVMHGDDLRYVIQVPLYTLEKLCSHVIWAFCLQIR